MTWSAVETITHDEVEMSFTFSVPASSLRLLAAGVDRTIRVTCAACNGTRCGELAILNSITLSVPSIRGDGDHHRMHAKQQQVACNGVFMPMSGRAPGRKKKRNAPLPAQRHLAMI